MHKLDSATGLVLISRGSYRKARVFMGTLSNLLYVCDDNTGEYVGERTLVEKGMDWRILRDYHEL